MNGVWDAVFNGGGRGRAGFWTFVDSVATWHLYSEAKADARAVAGRLRQLGLERGSVVAGVLTNSYPSVVALVGTWLAGARFASFPVIARGMTATAYLDQLVILADQVEPQFILIDDAYLRLVPAERFRAKALGFQALLNAAAPAIDPDPLASDDVVFVQFSSGTTDRPRGAMLTPRAIGMQLAALAERLELNETSDVGVSWLPLSHDMGLFGCLLLAWTHDVDGALSTPQRFLANPGTWLEDCATFEATLTAVPPFAIAVAARWARTAGVRSIPSMRACLLGGDMVSAQMLTTGHTELGFREGSLLPAYGLAEATLGVTVMRPGAEPVAMSASELGLAEVLGSDDTALVSCGEPLQGSAVAIGAGHEVLVSSTSLAEGYWSDESATAEAFANGQVRTGDLGAIRDGQLFPAGRFDDVVVFNGRNIDARVVEAAVTDSLALSNGACALVPMESGGLALVIEAAQGLPKHIAQAARRAATQRSGIRIDDCVVVEKGSLPKTPSGKLKRHECRSLFAGRPVSGRRRESPETETSALHL
jgi:acyl-CoA synthetase (AMP-forming)/AMP-acid ligase II